MKMMSSAGDFFALDIGSSAVRMVQLSKAGSNWHLVKSAHVPVDVKVSSSDASDAQRKLAEIISGAISQSGITAKNVVIGVPSNKMFATVVDLPNVSKQELAGTIKYQMEQYIPMSVDEAKVDYALLGQSLHDQSKLEVLLASVSNAFSEARLDLVEGLGLNVLAIEPDPIALTRALMPVNVPDARLIIDVGDLSTDLVMTYGGEPRLIRTIPSGLQTLIKAATQNLNIQENQASQFIMKFGLAPDRLEGQVLKALEATLEQFTTEVTKSIKFFQTRYPNIPVGGMILSGYGVSIAHFPEYMANKTQLRTELGNPWARVKVSNDEQQKLLEVAPQFSVAVGLAQRSIE